MIESLIIAWFIFFYVLILIVFGIGFLVMIAQELYHIFKLVLKDIKRIIRIKKIQRCFGVRR